MSVFITIDAETMVDVEIGKLEREAARYMIARFELTAAEFKDAWDWVYGEWFSASGYQPDDKPCLERYSKELFTSMKFLPELPNSVHIFGIPL